MLLRKRYALLLLILLLAACASPATPEATPTVEQLYVAITPALRPFQGALAHCSQAIPSARLHTVERPASALDTDEFDLSIRLGEPEDLPAFTAPLAGEKVVLITHPTNRVTSLTSEQLQAIFGGRAQSWAELGGSDRAIEVWVGPPGDEVRQAFDRQVLNGGLVTPNARIAPTPEAMLEAVSVTPGAIGYLPNAWLSESVQSLELGIELPVLALADGQPTGSARDLLACLQGAEAQAIIAVAYTPLNDN